MVFDITTYNYFVTKTLYPFVNITIYKITIYIYIERNPFEIGQPQHQWMPWFRPFPKWKHLEALDLEL